MVPEGFMAGHERFIADMLEDVALPAVAIPESLTFETFDSGPAWPTAWSSVTLRLYPEGSGSVVNQSWLLRPVDIIRPEGGELIFDYR
jgi:hypothetical protein